MGLGIAIIAAITGYLFGSLSFARIVTRIVAPDVDISEGFELVVESTGESLLTDRVAGTAVAQRLGDRYGCLVGIGDILKAVVPALAFRLTYPDTSSPYYLIAAFTAVVGHNWPIYHRFHGGTGLSPITGGFLVMDWVGTVATSILSTVLGLFVIRGPIGIYFAYSGGMLLMILWILVCGYTPHKLAYVVGVVMVYLIGSVPGLKAMAERRQSGAADIDTATLMRMLPMGRGLERIRRLFRRGARHGRTARDGEED